MTPPSPARRNTRVVSPAGRTIATLSAADRRAFLLYGAAFVAAFSAVAYELLLATYATFLLGATVFQYALVVSLMMASMGFGALVVHQVRARAVEVFLGVELVLATVASVAIPILYAVYATGFPPRFAFGFFVVAIGSLVGMEIPLLARFRKPAPPVSRILFFDYLGGFLGGILFPVALVPLLGLFRVGALLGVLNGLAALGLIFAFRRELRSRIGAWMTVGLLVACLAVTSLLTAERTRIAMEQRYFGIGVKP